MPIIFHVQMFKSKILPFFSLFDLFLHIHVIQDIRNTSLQYLRGYYLKYSISHTTLLSAFNRGKSNHIFFKINILLVKFSVINGPILEIQIWIFRSEVTVKVLEQSVLKYSKDLKCQGGTHCHSFGLELYTRLTFKFIILKYFSKNIISQLSLFWKHSLDYPKDINFAIFHFLCYKLLDKLFLFVHSVIF